MNLKPEEISKVIRSQIKYYSNALEQSEIGTVLTVGDGIVRASGLSNCMAGELLAFENGAYGLAQNLEENRVSIVLLGADDGISEGQTVKRTGKVVSVPVGDALLGRVVDALGQPIDGKGPVAASEYRPIERQAPGICDRQPVKEPLQTGIKAIDSMIPIGRGQRELIIGDRQTGKTAIAVDTIINQKGKGVICIYVAIGQKRSSVASIVSELEKNGAMEYSIVVAATASDANALKYIAPYSGCSMGEYFMENGRHVLIIYDDLSKHAESYRALSLLILATFSTYIHVCLSVHLSCQMSWEVVPLPRFRSLRHRQVMYLLIFRQMLFPSQTDRSFWRLNFSTQVFARL